MGYLLCARHMLGNRDTQINYPNSNHQAFTVKNNRQKFTQVNVIRCDPSCNREPWWKPKGEKGQCFLRRSRHIS